MKSITFNGERRQKSGTLHIEAPGCIINIQVGLTDSEGNPVTRVDVIADNQSGDRWETPDYKDENTGEPGYFVGVRVVKQAEPVNKAAVITPPAPALVLFSARQAGYDDGLRGNLSNVQSWSDKTAEYTEGYQAGAYELSEGDLDDDDPAEAFWQEGYEDAINGQAIDCPVDSPFYSRYLAGYATGLDDRKTVK